MSIEQCAYNNNTLYYFEICTRWYKYCGNSVGYSAVTDCMRWYTETGIDGGFIYDSNVSIYRCDIPDNKSLTKSTFSIENIFEEYYFLAMLMGSLFLFLGIIPLFDAKVCRKNDYFQITLVFSAIIQIFDMVTDVVFSINVWIYFHNVNYAF
eukprot:199907_1